MDGSDEPQSAPAEDPLAVFLRTREAYHEARGRLLVSHLPWLDSVVRRVMPRLPSRVPLEEVHSEAVDAFLALVESYDPARGKLTSFAYRRVVGAIADWMRRARKVYSVQLSLDELLKEDAPDND